MPLKLE